MVTNRRCLQRKVHCLNWFQDQLLKTSGSLISKLRTIFSAFSLILKLDLIAKIGSCYSAAKTVQVVGLSSKIGEFFVNLIKNDFKRIAKRQDI